VELLKICLNYLKLLQYHLISTIQQNHQFIGQKTYSTGRPQTQMEKKNETTMSEADRILDSI
jgi:hypothetical protein